MQILFFSGLFLAVALGVLALRQTRALPRRSMTNILVSLLLVFAALLIAFAYWGQYTLAGLRAFDEMDGLYPFAAGPLGTLLTAAAAATGWFGRRRSRSKD